MVEHSHFSLGQKLLDDCRVVGRGVVVQNEPVTRFTHARSNTSNSVSEPFHYTLVVHCTDSFTHRNKFVVDYALPVEENNQHALHTKLLKLQFFQSWRDFSDPCSELAFIGRIVGKTPADYFLFRKVKSHLKERLFDSISDIQKAVTSTLNTIAKGDFYKCI